MKALVLAVALATAQNPTPQPVQQALQTQPGLAEQARSRIAQSGLTPDQIRSRLVASGYPANLLDQCIGSAGPVLSTGPTPQELAAIQALGLPSISNEVLAPEVGLVRAVSGGPSDVFGVDVFRRTTTQFMPLLSGPVPPDYRLGPGDNLVLILTGDVELTYSLPITREGFILIPQVGQVHVANLTLEQLREVLYTRLGRVYSGVRRGANATTRFDVTVANVRANQIYVVGEVAQPGAYQISSLGTVFTALYAAGGVTELARLRAVEVQRGGKIIAKLDLYDYLLRGDTRSDIRLETGDVIFVPLHDARVRIAGAVMRPAVYETKGSETLYDIIQAAGGFRPEAALERLREHHTVVMLDVQPAKNVPAHEVIAADINDLDAIQMLWILRRMRDGGKYLDGREIKYPPKFFLGAAASPFSSNPQFQALREQKKINAGAQFFQTNLVFDINGMEIWLNELAKRNLLDKVYILIGIAPIKSLKMAVMLSEVPGVHIPERIIRRMDVANTAGKASEEGVQIALELITKIKTYHGQGIHGIHLMPVGWDEVVPRIVMEAGLIPKEFVFDPSSRQEWNNAHHLEK